MKKFIGFLILFSLVLSMPMFSQDIGTDAYLWTPVRTVASNPNGWNIQTPIYIAGDGAFQGFDVVIHYGSGISRVWYDYPNWWNFPSDWLSTSPYVSPNNDTLRFAMVGSTTKIVHGNVLLGFFTFHIDGPIGYTTRLDISASIVISTGATDTTIKLNYQGGYITIGPEVLYPGDMNGDRTYDLTDVRRVIRISHEEAGNVSLLDSLTADVTGDGATDSNDGVNILGKVVNPSWLFLVNWSAGFGGGSKGIVVQNPAGVVLQQTTKGVNIILAKSDSILQNGDFFITTSVNPEILSAFNGASVNLTKKGNVSHVSFMRLDGVPTGQPVLFLSGAKVEDVKIQGMVNNEVPIYPIIERTTGVEENQNVPSIFSLSQNYPNPFNPSTHIVYRVARSSQTKLTVFDLLGKEVARLVDEVKPAGEYEVNFNASNLPSGTYIYRLVSGEFTETKRMSFLK